jgi:murein DD-endopeptidase MepM/ murein hydrolase activator NlpD
MLACAALAASGAAPRAAAQAQAADVREDVRDLNQRLGELSLRVEQLEHENAELRARIAAANGARDTVTTAQLNTAIADLNASVATAVASSRAEILQQVATQMERLAKQTNAALDSLARQPAPAPQHPSPPAPTAQGAAARPAFGDSYPKEGVSYTVQKGDSIGLIAKKTGAKAQDIIDANKIMDPSRIQAGQVLVVPGGHLPQ